MLAKADKRSASSIPVVVELSGGLGNQMFQYAFGRSLADVRGSELHLDVSWFKKSKSGLTGRQYALDVFKIRAYKIMYNIPSKKILRIIRRFPSFALALGLRTETDCGFLPPACADSKSSYFSGYWQSPHYFSNNASSIFSDFTPVSNLSSSSQEYLDKLNPTKAVMIHVRRGDYLSSVSASSYHGVVDLAFYKTSIESCMQRIPGAKFYVFSDDIEWCQSVSLFSGIPAIYVRPDSTRSDWEDLLLMSYCNHHIIANSSFSWWSAWMADQRYGDINRVVFAPLNWFAQTPIAPSDRFPSHWNVC
jgi:hypothetical protein